MKSTQIFRNLININIIKKYLMVYQRVIHKCIKTEELFFPIFKGVIFKAK